jgi:hypothetical protein
MKEFYSSSISGKHSSVVGKLLFPDWDQEKRDRFMNDKEAHFRRSEFFAKNYSTQMLQISCCHLA